MSGPESDLVSELLAPVAYAPLVAEVKQILGVTAEEAREIVAAFDTFVARPLETNLKELRGRDLRRRNPMIYTVRGVTAVDDWVDAFLQDRETSAIEGHLGTFLEEVARIVSQGIKPGNGVDLQIDRADGVIDLYAIQTAPNTKNAGSRKSDIDALKRAARPLRAARRHVELNIATLHGRAKRGRIRSEPDIVVLGSDEFWERVSGKSDFGARLLRASVVLAKLIHRRAADEVARIKAEARALFASGDLIDVEALAAPTKPRP